MQGIVINEYFMNLVSYLLIFFEFQQQKRADYIAPHVCMDANQITHRKASDFTDYQELHPQ
jgi:hypothetical protein